MAEQARYVRRQSQNSKQFTEHVFLDTFISPDSTYTINACLSDFVWAKTWTNFYKKIASPGLDATIKQIEVQRATSVFSEFSEYCMLCSKNRCIAPPAQICNSTPADAISPQQDKKNWKTQILHHMSFIDTIGAAWPLWKKCWTEMPEFCAQLEPVCISFRDNVLHAFIMEMFVSWGKNRTDDIIGAEEDGFWPPKIRKYFFILLVSATHTWNEILVGPDSPFYADYKEFCFNKSLKTFGALYEQYLNNTVDRRTQIRLFHWINESNGLPLLPVPKTELSEAPVLLSLNSARQSSLNDELDKPDPSLFPWNELYDAPQIDVPFGTVSFSAAHLFMSKLWALDCDIVQNDAFQIFTTYIVMAIFARAINLNFQWPEVKKMLRKKQYGTDLLDVVYPNSDKPESERVEEVTFKLFTFVTWERWTMHWCRMSYLLSLFQNDVDIVLNPDCGSVFTMTSQLEPAKYAFLNDMVLRPEEAREWDKQFLAATKFATDYFRQGFGPLALGYTVAPQALELYTQTNPAIMARGHRNVLSQQRSSEHKEIIALLFNKFAVQHIPMQTVVSRKAALSHLKKTLEEETKNLSQLDPLVETRLKKQIYRLAFPLLFFELYRADQLGLGGGSGTTRLDAQTKLTNELKEKVAKLTELSKKKQEALSDEVGDLADMLKNVVLWSPNKTRKDADEILNEPDEDYMDVDSAADVPVQPQMKKNQKTKKIQKKKTSEKQKRAALMFEELERQIQNVKLEAKALEESIMKEIDQYVKKRGLEMQKLNQFDLFENRFFIVHYAVRSYGNRHQIETGQHTKMLKGMNMPRGFCDIFWSLSNGLATAITEETRDLHTETNLTPPWIVFNRGEYWLKAGTRLMVRTRCLESVLKVYTSYCHKFLPGDNLNDFMFDKFSAHAFVPKK